MNKFAVSGPVESTLTLRLQDNWSMSHGLPSLDALQKLIAAPSAIRTLAFDASGLGGWDSALLSFVLAVWAACRAHNIAVDADALPAGVRRLISLALAAPQRTRAAPPAAASLVTRSGEATLRELRSIGRAVTFLGDGVIALIRLVAGRARFRASDLFLLVQECGAQALPIVTIISLLVGMIFAFVGAVQLRQFDADIYDANLVAVAMAREMAAVMTGIVLAGRTGAAFAAQIGAMQGNEEIDALSTLGISPIEFLVLPRMLALVLMTPLLCIYANALGIFGGFLVGISTLNVTPTAYLLQTQGAVTLGDFTIGVVKAAVFGILIAITGCLRGIEAGRSAAAVGAATTSAVVTGIVAIIATDAIFAVLLNFLGL